MRQEALVTFAASLNYSPWGIWIMPQTPKCCRVPHVKDGVLGGTISAYDAKQSIEVTMKRNQSLLMMMLAALSFPAAAQMKEMPAGLWEMRHKIDMPGMPPEMAAKMGNRVITTCVKPGEQKWNEQRNPNEKGDRKCEQTELKFDGNKVMWKMKCIDGTTGEGVLAHNGKDSYTHTMNINSPRGAMKSVTEGKRIAETCEKK